MTQIKICGITNIEDALCAAECGADAVGFIFHKASPRYITPEKATEIIAGLPQETIKVGVFVNREADEVVRIDAACGLDLIQLHGDESPDYCRAFAPERIIKAVFPRTAEDLLLLEAFDVRALLVDCRIGNQYGGTGKQVDWALAASIGKHHPLILAGGLTVENMAEAIAAVAPSAVDINSGIEKAPGVKDHERMKRIIAIVREAGLPGSKTIFGKVPGQVVTPTGAGVQRF